MGPFDPYFTKLKLKLLFSHHIYSFYTFGFPWYGSELCGTVQIHTILYDVGQLGSFCPKCAVRSVFHETETETSIFTSYLLISYFWFSLIRFRTMRYRTNPYCSITRRPIGLVFAQKGPVRSIFHETETETSIFTWYLLISYFCFFLIRFRTMRYRTNPYYSIRRRPIGLVLAQMAFYIHFSQNLKSNFYFHIISTHFILLVFLYPVPNYVLPYKPYYSIRCRLIGPFWPKWAR